MVDENNREIELSVVVPVYNVEKYVGRCLQSILEQTYDVGEVICVDDGSTDGSLEVLKQYQKKDDRIRIVQKENGGVVSARKAGVRIARGKYITSVDSDDWIESEMYQEMMRLLIDDEADVVTSGCIRDYGDHSFVEPEGIAPGIYDGEQLREDLLAKMVSTDSFYESNISIHIINKIYRYDLLLKYQLAVDDYVNVGEDGACVYPCLLNAERIVVSGKNYYHYCMRSDSIMGRRQSDEADRYRALFLGLGQECSRHVARVPNIMEQMRLFEYYILLLQQAAKVISYEQGVLFPFGEIDKAARVVIYGAGRFGRELEQILRNSKYCNVVAWVDKKESPGVGPLEYLEEIEYDIILIAVLLDRVAVQIKQELLRRNVDRKKIYSVDYLMLKQQKIGGGGNRHFEELEAYAAYLSNLIILRSFLRRGKACL